MSVVVPIEERRVGVRQQPGQGVHTPVGGRLVGGQGPRLRTAGLTAHAALAHEKLQNADVAGAGGVDEQIRLEGALQVLGLL